jgi:Nucleotidyltransferase of unknown function (DUF6036)
MSINQSIDAGAVDTLLSALGEQLVLLGQSYSIVVVGGSALLALGLVSRPTRDVDVVALLDDGSLVSAKPLPEGLLQAAGIVAGDFNLPQGWLNDGPAALADFGLPDDFLRRAVRRDYSDALRVLFASREDQIHLKLYAVVDQGPGRHLVDLEGLAPTESELLQAARWTRTHDASEGFRDVLVKVLDHLGVSDGSGQV